MKVPVLATLALLLATGAVFAQEFDPEDMELRIFDVSRLVTPARPDFAPTLGPERRHRWEEDYIEAEPRVPFQGDMLADLIRETIRIETWDEGADIQYREGGKLLVKNLPDANREIEALLRNLEADVSRRVAVSAELWELPAKAWGAVRNDGDPGEVPGAKRIASGSTETMPGISTVLKVTNRVRYVQDYDVEIAQGSHLSDPIVDNCDEGFALEILPRITLAGDRIVLHATGQSGRFRKPFRTLEMGIDEEYLPDPFRSDRRYHQGKLELPVYEEANASFSRVVRSGETFVVPILREGRVFALSVTAKVLGHGGATGFHDVGVLSGRWPAPWFGYPREYEENEQPLIAPRMHRAEEWFFRLCDGPEEIMDLLVQNVSPWLWEEGDAMIGVAGESKLYIHASEDLRRQVETFLKEREAEVTRHVKLHVSVYSTTAAVETGDAASLAGRDDAILRYATILTTLPGLRTGVQAGSRAAFLADYDVEVAQESRIADPIIGLSFDGIAANFTPHLSMDRRRVLLDLSLLLSHRGPIGQFDTGAQYLGPVDRFDTARTVLNQVVDMAVGAPYVIDAGPDPVDPDRHLSVTLQVFAE